MYPNLTIFDSVVRYYQPGISGPPSFHIVRNIFRLANNTGYPLILEFILDKYLPFFLTKRKCYKDAFPLKGQSHFKGTVSLLKDRLTLKGQFQFKGTVSL